MSRRWPNSPGIIRRGDWFHRPKSPIPYCGCAARAPARSRDRRSRSPVERYKRNRHCERSEAIHASKQRKNGLLRRFAPRNDNENKENPMTKPANPVTLPLAEFSPQHFLLKVDGSVATVTLNRPERKNPLTFESYRELSDFFRACAFDDEVKTIVVSG